MRWFLVGFGIGIALDFVVTAAQVATDEYTIRDAPELLVWNLPWAPLLGAITAWIGLMRTRHPGPWMWRRPRFRTRTLMVVVAYSAFLISAVVTSFRLKQIEMLHLQKMINCQEMVKVFREQGTKYEAELKLRRENVALLQAGKIPMDLFPGQGDFLRSLEQDPKVTPEYREYRRGLIRETQEDAAARSEQTIAFSRRIVEYFEQLAIKYHRARLRPWLPVEPDPPMPK